jgi:ABC-type transporter Mla subunit MlaD
MLAKGKNVDDLPDQTTQLLKKQKELMANMDKLQPLLDTAEKFMGTTKKVDGFATLSSSYAEYK